MFEISFLLAIYYIILNLILPFLAGIMFLWIFFGNKFKGFLLYLFSWFSGVGVIFFSIFNFQFFHFGVGKIEYFILLILLIIIFSARLKIKGEKIKDYIDSFKLKFSFSFFKKDFLKLTKIEKVFFSICTIFLVFFVSLSFAHTLSFPNYFDDSFGNWNTPAMNIFYDGGFKLFGDKTEILGHGRLGYPIYVPIYKAIITDFVGYWNDIYSNIFQYFIFLFLVFFTILISYKHTKNLFYAILPATLITGLPLVYFHTLEGYLELTSATYAVLTIYSFYKFLEKKDYDFIILGTLFGIILSHIKNDGIIVYLPGIICSFLIILLLKKEFVSLFKNLIKKENIYRFLFMIFFLFLPFLLIKAYYGIGFNQAAGEESAVGIEKIHTEIFPIIKHIFINQDNYNIVLVFVVLLFVGFFNNKNEKKNNLFILLSFILTFIIIILVFLLTSNYRFVMDQTTVNRVFTMIFVILFSFSSYLLAKKHD